MDNLKVLYDSLPDREELLDFDAFFIGEGSAKLVPKVGTDNYYAQMFNKEIQQFSSEDLTDWEDFDGEHIEVIDYEGVFYEAKKRVFDLVGYVEKRFRESKNPLVRLKDLVVSDVDRSFIEYLRLRVDDYNTLYSIAELVAYRELGYEQVRFRCKDGCPICECLDKNVYSIQQVLDNLSQGNSIAHKYCDCSFEPFGKFYGLCDIMEGGIEVINCPIEWKDHILERAKELGYTFVVFDDAEKYMTKQKINFSKGTTVFEVRKKEERGIFVDRSFVGFYSAIDYLDKAEFEKIARLLSREGVDYIDPKDMKGDVYMMKLDDGSTAVVIGYANPVTGKYEMRLQDTGELVVVQD